MRLKFKSFSLLALSIIGIVILSVIVGCSNDDKAKKSLNPNGDSELAMLMRAMLDSSANIKALISKGKMPENFPEEFLKIHTAKPTDPKVRTPEYEAFATSFVEGLDQLYKSPPEDFQVNYNSLVQRCANCHKAICPGPLKAINKLWITDSVPAVGK